MRRLGLAAAALGLLLLGACEPQMASSVPGQNYGDMRERQLRDVQLQKPGWRLW